MDKVATDFLCLASDWQTNDFTSLSQKSCPETTTLFLPLSGGQWKHIINRIADRDP